MPQNATEISSHVRRRGKEETSPAESAPKSRSINASTESPPGGDSFAEIRAESMYPRCAKAGDAADWEIGKRNDARLISKKRKKVGNGRGARLSGHTSPLVYYATGRK